MFFLSIIHPLRSLYAFARQLTLGPLFYNSLRKTAAAELVVAPDLQSMQVTRLPRSKTKVAARAACQDAVLTCCVPLHTLLHPHHLSRMSRACAVLRRA